VVEQAKERGGQLGSERCIMVWGLAPLPKILEFRSSELIF